MSSPCGSCSVGVNLPIDRGILSHPYLSLCICAFATDARLPLCTGPLQRMLHAARHPAVRRMLHCWSGVATVLQATHRNREPFLMSTGSLCMLLELSAG
jgi:hypothetical protein